MVGFVLGFALGGRGPDGADEQLTASGSVPSSVTSVTTTTPSTTETTTTTVVTTVRSTTTTAPVATTEPTTTEVVPFPTIATTAPSSVVTTVPTTLAPSRVVVTYAADGSGRLVVPRGGSATLIITNQGGLAQQWLVTGTGFTTAGTSQGNLGPGQTVTVAILPPREELPAGEINGIISVLGAVNATVPFVIPAA